MTLIEKFYPVMKPWLFRMDAERAHTLTVKMMVIAHRLGMLKSVVSTPQQPRKVMGLTFPNVLGLAAGMDKSASAVDAWGALGFGFVEVGTLTPLPQEGNPKPRLFRLAEDEAVINRMGFNNQGQAAAAARLGKRDRGAGILGINIGANKDSADRIADYAAGVRAMLGLADYLTINISSPNTPGLRALQDKGALAALLEAVMDARGAGPPVFLKVAPDLEPADIDDIARDTIDHRLDALIVANTTLSRPMLESAHRDEAGGLSGAPLKQLALQRLRDFRSATGGSLPLIAAGGIGSGADAFARIKAGASLVQLYSALAYRGPGLAKAINAELKALLAREGFATIVEAVGADA